MADHPVIEHTAQLARLQVASDDYEERISALERASEDTKVEAAAHKARTALFFKVFEKLWPIIVALAGAAIGRYLWK